MFKPYKMKHLIVFLACFFIISACSDKVINNNIDAVPQVDKLSNGIFEFGIKAKKYNN